MPEDAADRAGRIIGVAAPYRVILFGEAVAFLLIDLSTGRERLLAFQEAHLFRCDLNFLQTAQRTPGSEHHGIAWEDCVAGLVERRLEEDPATRPGKQSPQVSG